MIRHCHCHCHCRRGDAFLRPDAETLAIITEATSERGSRNSIPVRAHLHEGISGEPTHRHEGIPAASSSAKDQLRVFLVLEGLET
ncbi:hypothetical protein GUJ93_ZPchr0007g4652 [Zizania palustris]|uniref:Uncharacterized protein n=1 Tax=Zizania palustris TaxID=103762 RepID=A0A8J5TD28_ZIZPA|nr:hypothetical protein GUJ93_ZPchr0007g4652 [Zizania palustris]